MIRRIICILTVVIFSLPSARGQQVLPEISVKNFGGRTIISWKNEYTAPLATINIQRSFDSLKNYTTIGSVLNPANRENGYADVSAPYQRMYYRVFINFENGSFTYSRPVKAVIDELAKPYGGIRYSWQYQPVAIPPDTMLRDPLKQKDLIPVIQPATEEKRPAINYVSLNRDQHVALYLPDAGRKSYSLQFFDESGREAFKLNNLREDSLVIEKVNFIHSGWFSYELYESGNLLMKEKIFIPKDQKPGVEARKP